VLNEGIDYLPSHWFIAGSRSCATPIYGSILIMDTEIAGVIKLEYQTLGGIWSLDLDHIAVILSDIIHNPRTTSWDEVIDKPISFPPIDHEWNLVDMVGASDIVNSLNNITAAVVQKQITGLGPHLADYNNPHKLTAAKLGCYTKAEVDAKIAQAIANLGI